MSQNLDSVIATLENQIKDLRRETAQINDRLSDHGFDLDDIREHTRHLYRGASRGVRKAAGYARREGSAAAGVMKENPATTTSVLATAGLVGIALWWFLDSRD